MPVCAVRTLLDDWRLRLERLTSQSVPTWQEYRDVQVRVLNYLIKRYANAPEGAQAARYPLSSEMVMDRRAILVHEHFAVGRVSAIKCEAEARERASGFLRRVKAIDPQASIDVAKVQDPVFRGMFHDIDREKLGTGVWWWAIIVTIITIVTFAGTAGILRLDRAGVPLEILLNLCWAFILGPGTVLRKRTLMKEFGLPYVDWRRDVAALIATLFLSIFTQVMLLKIGAHELALGIPVCVMAGLMRIFAQMDAHLRILAALKRQKLETVDDLRLDLAHSDSFRRVRAARLLAERGSLDDISLLSDLLTLPPQEDESPAERADMAQALEQLANRFE